MADLKKAMDLFLQFLEEVTGHSWQMDKESKKMTTNQFLQKFRLVKFNMNVTRPMVKCADGYTVSVQAGYGIRSHPQADADEYTAVELGYPSQSDEEIIPYAENTNRPCETVYNFVPVEIVDKLFEKHGGIVGADFSNVSLDMWGEEYRNDF